MKPLETPFEELSKPFQLDFGQTVTKACEKIIEANITPEEKEEFYTKELSKILTDIVNQDVEWSSLRLEQN